MEIHLPIAQVAVDPFVIAGLGTLVGFVSGLFGVGGGFLLTPLLIFYGVPPAVAASTQANQVLATSLAGASSHWREGSIDFRLGNTMLVGGLAGSAIGVLLFAGLKHFGVIDAVISVLYVILLGVIGGLMLWESIGAVRGGREDPAGGRRTRLRAWTRNLPMKRRFPRSGLYISAIPPALVGFAVGLLSAVLGIGGGFILGPAMVYLIGVPTRVMVGTSLFQIIFLTAFVTLAQATINHSVDLVLAVLLMIGGVVGARFGVAAGRRLKAAQVRLLLALVILGLGVRLAGGMIFAPHQEYILEKPR